MLSCVARVEKKEGIRIPIFKKPLDLGMPKDCFKVLELDYITNLKSCFWFLPFVCLTDMVVSFSL